MPICKFFLQGTCRFGNSCKFDHQVPDHNYGASNSVLLQNYAPKPTQTASVDTNALIKSVVNDMTSAEKGGQWLLSCYAPFKEKPVFPGFEDHSMEEIRYQYYESVKNGTVEQYKQNLQRMLQQAMMKIKALQNPSRDAVNMLRNIYTMQSSENRLSFRGQDQSRQQSASIFGGGTTGQSVFGGQNNSVFPNQDLRATLSNMYPNSQMQPPGYPQVSQQSVFGGQQQQQQAMFTQPQQPTTITQPQQPMAFTQQQPATITQPMTFNQQQPATNTQPMTFNQQQPATNTQPMTFNQQQQPATNTQPMTFNQQQPTTITQAMTFNQQQPTTITQPPQAQLSIFGQQTQPVQVTSQNVFQRNNFVAQNQQPMANNQALQHTSSIFGNLVGNSQTAKPDNFSSNYYSKMEDLSEEDIKWFNSDTFDIDSIPEKPPTYEMCFNT